MTSNLDWVKYCEFLNSWILWFFRSVCGLILCFELLDLFYQLFLCELSLLFQFELCLSWSGIFFLWSCYRSRRIFYLLFDDLHFGLWFLYSWSGYNWFFLFWCFYRRDIFLLYWWHVFFFNWGYVFIFHWRDILLLLLLGWGHIIRLGLVSINLRLIFIISLFLSNRC